LWITVYCCGLLWGRCGWFWIVVGSLQLVVNHCVVGVAGCGSLWGRCRVVVARSMF
jgi:hypothetical protein